MTSKTSDSDCQLPMANGQLPNPLIGNRKLEIGNSRLQAVHAALETVFDPEIPVLNVVDMGIIAAVYLECETVIVEMTPTFVGCPAVDMIRADIFRAVAAVGEKKVAVRVVFDPPWTSDRLTEEGRRRLKEFGLAPPMHCGRNEPQSATCPHCDSTNTEMESLFGPTLCRSIHYCHTCLQSFERFKTL